MEGYDVNDASVYNQQGSVLKRDELNAILCSLCRFILREAMQVTQCGHRFCKKCIEKLMSAGSEEYKCPVDDEPFVKTEVRRDRGCQKEISALEVDCPIRPNPCKWRGPLIEIEVHRLECPQALVWCTLQCGLDLRRDELATHLSNDCVKRPLNCPHCNMTFPSEVIESHFLECPEHPVVCDNCHLYLANRKSLQKHLQRECSNYEMKCPLKCQDFKGERSSLIEHMKSHSLDVVQLLLATVTRVELLETKQCESDETIATLTQRLEEVTAESKEMQKRMNALLEHSHDTNPGSHKDELHAITKYGATNRRRNAEMHTKPNSSVQSRPKSLMPLSGHFKSGINPTKRGDVGVDVGVHQMREDIESHDTQLLKMSETLQTVQSHLTQYGVAIDEVRLRQDILDVKVTNGLLIWKIPDIRRRYRDAVDGRTMSLYSPPFYTSPHGYRMCIRTYLNGDGTGKGTHISLFFVVMRSEQDNLLPWPFKQSVRFTLINQKNEAASITEAFVPDLKSPSFHKPERDMNIASGFPKFAPQSVLKDENFTLGNMIYIKCQIDVSGLNIE